MSDEKRVIYIIEDNPELFESRINDGLDKGYVPWGNHCCFVDGPLNWYSILMIKHYVQTK